MSGLEEFKQLVELVRSRIDLVSLIGETVKLTSRGSFMTGRLAPPSSQNGSKNQSLVVWTETSTWRDFSQGFGGDCFSWMQHVKNLGFRESVLTLAARSGVKLPEEADKRWHAELEAMASRRTVQQLLTKAAIYYHRRLPQDIRDSWYRKRYGLTDETIEELQLGWADGHLYVYLTEELGYARSDVLATGLFVETDAGTVHDFFQNRLVFPYWHGGNVVYFIARQTELTPNNKWEESKYKKLLTRSAKRKYVSEHIENEYFYNEDAVIGADEVLITEGVTDCISAKQCGVRCISPVTTRFRNADIPHLIRVTERCKRIVICNDNEANESGEKGARDTAAALWGAGRYVRIARIPRPEGRDKIDINELVVEQGPEAFRQVIAKALSYPEYLMSEIPADAAPIELQTLLEPVFRALVVAPALVREPILVRLTKRFGIPKREANKILKDTEQAIRDERKQQRNGDPQEEPRRPLITTNRGQTGEIVDEALTALVTANQKLIDTRNLAQRTPIIFNQFGVLVQVGLTKGMPTSKRCQTHSMRLALSNAATWVKANNKGEYRDDATPIDIGIAILEHPNPGIQEFDGFLCTPVFSREGKIISERGYHPKDLVWMHIDKSLGEIVVPESPTKRQIEEAKSMLLNDLLVDFKFVSDSDLAHMIAAILLPFVRRMINGPTPMHVIEAPTPSSGKSLLCNLVSIIATGQKADMTTMPPNEDEFRKSITAGLVEAPPVLVFDNAKEGKEITSESLASVLTTVAWKTRLLGRSEEIHLPNNATWLVSGNNISMSGELTRRSIRIRTDTGVSNPSLRLNFKHKELQGWALNNRKALVTAALTLVQAWIADGMKPCMTKALGSFESWVMVMGGILDCVGIPGLLDNTKELRALADVDTAAFEHFISTWWEQEADMEVHAAELLNVCTGGDCLSEKIACDTERGRQTKLGIVLAQLRDRVYLNYKVCFVKRDRKGRAIYKLKNLDVAGSVVPLPTEEPTNLTAWPPAENTAAVHQQIEAPEPTFVEPVQQELYEDDPFTSQD